MEKFIEFNSMVLNTRHIIKMRKIASFGIEPQYGILLEISIGQEQQWFKEEYERDTVFNQLLEELLNE